MVQFMQSKHCFVLNAASFALDWVNLISFIKGIQALSLWTGIRA